MIKIYHNPRCSKSREGVKILENSKKEFEIIKYLEDTLTQDKLEQLINLLGIAPIQLIRKNEKIWKEKFKGKELSDNQIIKAMIANPKLIERPIIVNNNTAITGCPAEKIIDIL